MTIAENQLRTWSQLGAQARSQRTYQSIRNALGRHVWPPAMGSPSVYLQGSYRNHTNIAGDSDVDVVVESSGVFCRRRPRSRRARARPPRHPGRRAGSGSGSRTGGTPARRPRPGSGPPAACPESWCPPSFPSPRLRWTPPVPRAARTHVRISKRKNRSPCMVDLRLPKRPPMRGLTRTGEDRTMTGDASIFFERHGACGQLKSPVGRIDRPPDLRAVDSLGSND